MAKIHLDAFIILTIVIPFTVNALPTPLFIFGDSTADVGTNTYLRGSKVRADFPPYGIDFPSARPTGRFSNGYNSADFVAKFFGFKRSPPPFLFLLTLKPNHFQNHLVKGANFASAGAGILDETGPRMSVVPISQQINQFSYVKDNLTAMIGSSVAGKLLSKSLIFISVGGNDVLGYFAANSTMLKDQFISILISAYSRHIKKLYKLGARKFGIISVPPVGCCPSQRVIQKLLTGANGCFEAENDFCMTFHSALDRLLVSISSQLPGFTYSLGNGYRMTIDVTNNPHASGFKNVDSACCGYGLYNAQGSCNWNASVCEDRHKYLFWDQFHPTKKAAYLAAQTLYSGTTDYVTPINFSQLKKGC